MAKKIRKKTKGGFRPGAGRKTIEDEPLTTKSFPCGDSRWERYKEAAESEGMSAAEWIRHHLDAAADAALGE